MAEIWDRQTGEPARWFRRFERYLQSGPNRTIENIFQDDAARIGTGRHVSGAWKRNTALWRWKERAEAFDLYQVALEHEAYETKLADQRAQMRAKTFDLSVRLLERAEEMLEYPLTTTKIDDVGAVHVHPAKWSYRDIVAILEIVGKMAGESENKEAAPEHIFKFEFGSLPVDLVRSAAYGAEPAEPAEPE